jgi:hypothetical protein
MDSKWRSELLDGPFQDNAVWRLGHRWDWGLIGWWLLALCFCLAVWGVLGLSLAGQLG